MRRWSGPVAVGVVAWVAYRVTMAPGLWYGDAGELAHAVHHGALAHPPGYPLYVILARPFASLPGLSVAAGLNLFSVTTAAVACALTFVLLRRLVDHAGVAAGGAALWAAMPVFRAQATATEVYAPQMALLAGLAVVATGRGGVPRALGLGALVGAGLAHRPSLLLAIPGIVAGAILAGRARRPTATEALAASAGATVVAVGAWTWIGTRALADPGPHWGTPTDVASLWEHATAGTYAAYRVGLAGWFSRDVWWAGLGPGGIALLVVAFGVGAAAYRRHRAAVAAAAVGCATFAAFAATYRIPDQPVLFLEASWSAVVLLTVGIGALAGPLRHGRRWAGAGLLIVAVGLWAAHHRALDRSDARGAAHFADAWLESIPRDGILVAEGDELFLLAYRVGVEGARPDLTIYDRNGQLFRERIREPGPPLAPGESLLRYRARREVGLLERRDGRPVAFRPSPGYPLPAGRRLEPHGLVYLVGAVGAPPRPAPGIDPGPLVAEARRYDDPFAADLAAAFALMEGERRLFEGRPDAAEEAWARAAALAPDSEGVRNTLGVLHAQRGRLAEARDHFEAATRAFPRSWRAWSNLARVRRMQGDVRGARDAWERSLAIVPGQADALEGLRRLEAEGH